MSRALGRIIFAFLPAALFLAGCASVNGVSEGANKKQLYGSCQCDDVPDAPDRVYFDFDQSSLTLEARETLDKQAAWLKKYPGYKITIEGHCDERGTREYNLALGERRANAVRNVLIAAGVSASRISTISYGKERPIVLGSNEEAWAQNRVAITTVQ